MSAKFKNLTAEYDVVNVPVPGGYVVCRVIGGR